MAIYHLEAQIIGRSDGRSAVAAAAYRSGDLLLDELTGTPQKHGDVDRVAHSEIVAPAGAPAWATDREQLWNRVEAKDRRKNSQLAREFEVALPNELTLDQQRDLLRGFIAAEFIPHGIVADFAIHIDPKKDRVGRRSDHAKAQKARNDHAHIMTTMRGLAADGDGFSDKLRHLNWNGTIERWRASWAEHANAALKRAGVEARIDHRSHADRGIIEKPTIKEGAAAHGRHARGKGSDRIEINNAIRVENQAVRKRLAQIKTWIRARTTKEKTNAGPDAAPPAALATSKHHPRSSWSIGPAAGRNRLRGLPGKRVGLGRWPAVQHVPALQLPDVRLGHPAANGMRGTGDRTGRRVTGGLTAQATKGVAREFMKSKAPSSKTELVRVAAAAREKPTTPAVPETVADIGLDVLVALAGKNGKGR